MTKKRNPNFLCPVRNSPLSAIVYKVHILQYFLFFRLNLLISLKKILSEDLETCLVHLVTDLLIISFSARSKNTCIIRVTASLECYQRHT